MYKTIYTVYTHQYTQKVTVKDFILSKIAGLQLKTLLKNAFFQRYFSRKFQFFKNSSILLLLMAMTKYCNLPH